KPASNQVPAKPPAERPPAPAPTPEPPPPAKVEEEKPSPAWAGYQMELPIPQAGENGARSTPLALLDFIAPVLPARVTVVVDAVAAGQLASAGRVVLNSARASNHFIAPRGRGVEVREFARSMPLLELGLASVGGTSLDARVEPMAIVVSAS